MSINIPWLEVLKACYPNAQITEETEILVVSPQYTADIAVIMSTTDRLDLVMFLIFSNISPFNGSHKNCNLPTPSPQILANLGKLVNLFLLFMR